MHLMQDSKRKNHHTKAKQQLIEYSLQQFVLHSRTMSQFHERNFI